MCISLKASLMKKTRILKVNPQKPEIEKVQIAANILKKGGLVAFPTETVYGLGADALNANAVKALFKAKKRPLDNPPIVHIDNIDAAYLLAAEVPTKAEKLMKKFWPGPLTLVFERASIVPEVTVAGLNTVAIRMPQDKIALALIKESKCPIAAPSANLAGKPSPTSAIHVFNDLNGRIDLILDGGSSRIGVESTVLDMSVKPPIVLRPGGTSFEVLKKVVCEVRLHPFVVADEQTTISEVRSPGMKHKHYAPDAKLLLVEGSLVGVTSKIKELAAMYSSETCKIGVLATDETTAHYSADVIKSLGSRFNLDAIAQNLFKLLRQFDKEGVDVIIAEGLPAEGLGLAIMNRLRKASAYNIIRVD